MFASHEQWQIAWLVWRAIWMPLTFGALPFQTHRRRKAAEQRELSAEHYRACWELLSVAPWKGLPGVHGKSVGRHRRNSVWYRNWSLVHLSWRKVRETDEARRKKTVCLLKRIHHTPPHNTLTLIYHCRMHLVRYDSLTYLINIRNHLLLRWYVTCSCRSTMMGLCWGRWAAGWSMRGAVLVWLYCLDSSKGTCWWCCEKSRWWKFSSWTGEVCSTGLSRLPHCRLTGGLYVHINGKKNKKKWLPQTLNTLQIRYKKRYDARSCCWKPYEILPSPEVHWGVAGLSKEPPRV